MLAHEARTKARPVTKLSYARILPRPVNVANVQSAGTSHSEPVSPLRSAVGLVGWLLLSFAAAAFGSFFTPGDWYAALRKPAWNPPNWIFGPVWSVLYIMMAVSAWLVWRRGGFRSNSRPLAFFQIQLLLNAVWSWLFFGLQHPALAFAEILLLWLAIVGTILAFVRVHRLAAWLLSPYLAWVTFATALNFILWRLNAS